MKVLCVHPSGLLYTEIFLRLEPLGLELVAASLREAGHEVRLVDLQAVTHRALFATLREYQPDAVCFGLNYVPNLPEVVDLAKAVKRQRSDCFVFVGGHSASFTAQEMLEHADGAIDCVIKGEGEETAVRLVEAAADDRAALHRLPGVVTREGEGPPAGLIQDLDALLPARDLLQHRHRYFLGILDPCASIELTRGCPWDCVFCSAWTFYGRSYRQRSPERVAEELQGIREPGIFIVDDVAFIHADHGFAIGEAIERRGIKKEYYLETRGDVLLRNKEVFRLWKRLGLNYMFLGLEAIDEEGLKLHRKRVSLGRNFEALEFARSLGVTVAVNLIADPDWDERRFAAVREWALSVPEVVNISINTPYPGTETFLDQRQRFATRDYRLFDIQHAVLPTKLPLERYYQELVRTQQVLNQKHLGFTALRKTAGIALRLLLRGQTNFLRMLWKFNSVYNPERLLADHQRPVRYAMRLPSERTERETSELYVVPPQRLERRGAAHAPAAAAQQR